MASQWVQLIAEFDQMSELSVQDHYSAISKAQMEWLWGVAAEMPVKRALDLGFGCGFSAMVMAKGECEVTCVNYELEDFPKRVQAVQRFERVCGRKPKILSAPTDRALPRLCDEGQSFGLIFIDAGHRIDDVFIDVHYSARLCVPGGIMALDDTYYGAIRCVVNWINSNLGHIW